MEIQATADNKCSLLDNNTTATVSAHIVYTNTHVSYTIMTTIYDDFRTTNSELDLRKMRASG